MKSNQVYTAKRLPVHRGTAAWNAILPSTASHPKLDQDVTADLVVVGGGFAGLSAVYRSLQINPNVKVVLLEAGTIGEGASGRNTGFMIDLPHDLTSEDYSGTCKGGDLSLIKLNRTAIAFAKDAVDNFGVNPDYFEHAGKINGATSNLGHSANVSYAEHLKRLNESCEMLDAQQMYELTGSKYYVSGLYTPGTIMLQPAGYVRGLAEGLRKSAKIYESSPVTSLTKTGTSWTAKTLNGSVTASKIILANNGHLESFGFEKNRLMHIFLFAMMTPALDTETLKKLGGSARWGITPSDPMGTTMRKIDNRQGGDRIVTRSCASFEPDMEVSEDQMKRAARVMRKKFESRFPQLAGMQMEYEWAGHLCLSRNSVSVSGELDDGLFAACCQNGLGTTRGTLTGIAAAELANGIKSEITAYFEQEDRPAQLPPPPLSTIGANVYLRWKEHKARLE